MTGMGVDHECPEHLLQFHVPGLGSISSYVMVFTAIAIAHPPDHVMVVIGPFRFLVVIRLMRRIKSRSTLTINRRRQSKERVWQPGYHDRAVRVEDDVRKMARYIIANPLRAGLVERVGDYSLWDAVWL